MGRATRWLRSLLTGKKDSKDGNENTTCRREKKRWSFGKSARDGEDAEEPAANAPWLLRPFYAESEEERSRRAMAVAAATAAAADAAVAAAQAAVAVVRLTSHRRGGLFGGGAREQWAATKIQTVFRGFLARKALRALRALVKLQALVRGYLVRRQAMAALHGMQALVRVQATARSQRSAHLRPRRSLERLDEVRSEYAASFHSGRLSSSVDYVIGGVDDSTKVVEIDPGRPKSRSRRPSSPWRDVAPDALPPHCPVPPRISTPDRINSFRDNDWSLTGDECRFSTAQSTPRFVNLAAGLAPATPTKGSAAYASSPAGGGGSTLGRPPQSPNYMTKTQSFEAKVRSQSAPRQRPEPAGVKKRLSLCEAAESRASCLAGVPMQRSCSQSQVAFDFKNAVVGRLGHATELGRGVGRDYSLQRRW